MVIGAAEEPILGEPLDRRSDKRICFSSELEKFDLLNKELSQIGRAHV